jgi:alkylation response protein AidB-like acyl-CoA dehydrogenase
LTTSAVLEGDEFILNGQKTFITGAKTSDIILVMVRTDKTVEKHQGISMLLMESKAPGVEYRKLKKLGQRPLDAYEVFLNEVRVPRKNLLGELNQGWNQVLKVLDHERFCVSLIYLGGAQAVLEDSVQYAKQRVQFGQPIGKFQMIKEKLADMLVAVEASRLLIYRTAWMIDEGIPCAREGSMAKLFTSETYMRAAHQGLQIMGGYGYMMEYDMQRHFRDAKLSEIGAGSSEIQRLLLARTLGV